MGGFFASSSTGDNSAGAPPSQSYEPQKGYLYPLTLNDCCSLCQSIEIDEYLKKNFKVFICAKCKEENRDAYSLITKTTAKEKYLLSEEELADTAILPSVCRPNPLKTSWSQMRLYLKVQVENFATTKWGTLKNLEEELINRASAKEIRAEKRFKASLKGTGILAHFLIFVDLRRKTKIGRKNLSKDDEPQHRHDYIDSPEGKKKCRDCGLCIDVEEL